MKRKKIHDLFKWTVSVGRGLLFMYIKEKYCDNRMNVIFIYFLLILQCMLPFKANIMFFYQFLNHFCNCKWKLVILATTNDNKKYIRMTTTSFFSGEIIRLGRNCQEWDYMVNASEYFYGTDWVVKLLTERIMLGASWLLKVRLILTQDQGKLY